VPARSTPDDYAAHISAPQANGPATFAASIVSADEVKRLFAFDISKSYVVFEVAVYPKAGSTVDLDPDGFVVRSSRDGEPVRNTDSVTVASVIQQKNLPPPPSKGPVVVASTAVGYESGTDPYTGQRVHGTYTASQVAVGNGRDYGPPAMPSPGGYPQDRVLLENQLWDKSLPSGQIRQPAAGFLYFPISLLKKNASGAYELEYLGSDHEPELIGSNSRRKIVLEVPAKKR
jgi:hypothetical protein